MLCTQKFGLTKRRHHCRCCGWVVCAECLKGDAVLLDRWVDERGSTARDPTPQKVCTGCRTHAPTPAAAAAAAQLGLPPPGAAPVPAPKVSSAIQDLLAQAKLTQYSAAIAAAEYVELSDLLEAETAELQALVAKVEMSAPAAKRFRKAIQALGGPAPPGAASPATAPAAGGSTAPGASAAAVAAEPEPEPEQEPLAATLDKYIAADKQIRLGKGSDAAHGIKVLLGVSDAIIGTYLQQHEAAIEQEFTAHGTAEDKANYRCVLAGTRIPGWACPGISVDSLLAHASAQTAKLGRHHIIALRLYTTSSYSRINDPLRADPPHRPHPFAATTYFISDGIRLLRAVAANRPDAYIERILWRGLKDVGITGQFMTEGGTDYACVSTTASQEVAVLNFAASSLPLVFRIVTKNCINRGADISFLSVFPNEQEFLYPPLTYLHCVKMERETLCGVQLLVATVEPTMV